MNGLCRLSVPISVSIIRIRHTNKAGKKVSELPWFCLGKFGNEHDVYCILQARTHDFISYDKSGHDRSSSDSTGSGEGAPVFRCNLENNSDTLNSVIITIPAQLMNSDWRLGVCFLYTHTKSIKSVLIGSCAH